MKDLNRNTISNTKLSPIKVVQFGEGNFLRAFVDFAFHTLNEVLGFNAGIAVVQPIEEGMVPLLNTQDGLYTLFTKGIKNGKETQEKVLISNIVKGVNPYLHFEEYLELAKEEELEFVISNTTEAGISYDKGDTLQMSPPNSFPAKLTRFLYERYKHYKGNENKGLTIIPCELINYNADTLKRIILDYISLWELSEGFKNWIIDACSFHNTLVDRIVPGYPKDQIEIYNSQLEYRDQLIVSAETFFLWVIEGNSSLKEKLPFHKTDLDVRIVGDMQPYRTRKVRILNGAHTAMVPFSILYGNETVKETIDKPLTGSFVHSLIFDEVIPTLDMEREELETFANAVFDRFKNPFIRHQLSSIALNTVSKFKVRVLPSLLKYVHLKNELPVRTVFSFACLIRFYKGSWKGKELPINDDDTIITYFKELWQLEDLNQIVEHVLGNVSFWETDLNKVQGLSKAVVIALECLEKEGVENGYKNYSKKLDTKRHAT